MVQLIDSDIKTREVLDWKGVHVLHFMGSSCSQKLRVFLNLKGIPWQSHHIFAPPGPPKPAEALQSYAANGSGTVQGLVDRDKQIQIEFWERAAKEGFTDEAARISARKFRAEFDAMDKVLARQFYLMGDRLTVLDIAWLIYAHRLSLAGYPLERLHPNVFAWQDRLASRPEFAKEIAQLRDPN